jgi:two-component system sensor histidine kinase FlrB
MHLVTALDQETLSSAFHQFTRMSGELVEAYGNLQAQVDDLGAKLRDARQERARELAEKERLADRLALLLEALPGGVVVLGGDGVVRECNPAAEALLGEPLAGKLWRDVAARAFRPRPDDGHDISLASGARVSLRTCSLGREPGQILLINDVTETRRLQDRVAHLQRLSAMGEMAASLAHQVRTPLSSALLYTGALGGHGLSEAQHAGYVERLRGVLTHLESVVGDMLTFARSGSLQLESVEAEALCARVAGACAALCEREGVHFASHCDAAGALLRGNAEALASVVQNLVVNAIQAAGDADLRVWLAVVRQPGGALAIRVRDDGPGIPAELAERIFEPFVSGRSGGTGLGLAVVRAVVEAHGGLVELESAPGAGTTFTLRLPLLEGQAGAPQTPGESER